MSNAAGHRLFAFASISTISAAMRSETEIAPHLLNGATAALLASLPDQIEPALHPNHRQFFHSVIFAGALGYGMYRAYKWEPQSTGEKIFRWFALIAGAAYLSHLALDACSAKSLPLLGKLS